MSLRAHIQYAKPGRGLFDRAEVAAAAAAGNAAAVEHWHEVFLPLHFEEAAKKRYGYQPRRGSGEPPYLQRKTRWSVASKYQQTRKIANPAYYWRKLREKGHTKSLVYTGRSEQAAKQIRITSSAARGVGVLFALPKYFYQYRTTTTRKVHRGWGSGSYQPTLAVKHTAPDKAAELTVVLDTEAAAMGRAAEKAMTDALNGAKTARASAA